MGSRQFAVKSVYACNRFQKHHVPYGVDVVYFKMIEVVPSQSLQILPASWRLEFHPEVVSQIICVCFERE